ncbi:(deoxy)nucleoside triphosphate pyrophosphohydrolase [Mucilaginibacter sp. KACC 22063]|uniref:(deoxy)nucleoside triphosphate pyrophosphohydrolase n=1 Tax=Mucilaginibacter sp. KACC 22063 TaxID=3025666 RepID=UPI0023654026|nr:(deoxy)nucleoside triphosphate pyrophosphohydrolase [Mucilaginibacter sp. KACC 22063]WDF55246.1 (deoxy)nucleoside triphosphate pyrophosphohydrolase [Mucilaginibacter sp. KACC 22063]
MIIPVAAAIIIKDNKIMIAKRSQHKHLGGFWEFPGGKIEANETAENCLLRELNEELKIKIKVISYLAENTYDYGSIKILLKAFICHFISGQFTLIDHDEVRWVTTKQLQDYNMAPADIPFLKLLTN